MSKTSNSWEEQFKITSLLVNPLGRLGLFGLLNLLQETAWMHAEKFGFGMKDMESQGLFWVLTRQTVEISKWPSFGNEVHIRTWLRPPEGAFVTRDFTILDSNKQEIGKATTSWLALDRHTRKILPIQKLRNWEDITSTENTGLSTDKISVAGAYTKLAKYRVRNSDLDINQHVNNTKYAQWILDSIPYSLHKGLRLKSYTVNFLAETHLGDEVQIDRAENSCDPETTNQGASTYRGICVEDQRILFTAKMNWEKQHE
ncbi:acyl-[acyl-carrier-protein] thioesterase [Bdellovibrio bacteriovorus]|uniref:acyl-[acyl-carrier-protein] thioesterase n=1 Tax=Bdellovibrio bacteriovorus TaxID=959 RepID=UPI0009C12308|nr:acyl-ACP thioesterase domain-containing protein [Bdellovibrio bacteriovorus]